MENTTQELGVGWTILVYGIWIGIVFLSAKYSKGVAKKLNMNQTIAVLAGIFFPILGALIYSNLNYRADKKAVENKQA